LGSSASLSLSVLERRSVSVELTVALISAAAAVLAALLTVVVSARTTRVTAELQDKLERQRHQASKEELLEQVMSRYREPLVRAAFDLQSRIYNIVKQAFLVRYLRQGRPDEQEYACRNTVFVVAEYLGWVEILRRGVQFLDLGDVERNRSLSTGWRLSARCCWMTGSIRTPPFRCSVVSNGR
jgi:hypothetical protein